MGQVEVITGARSRKELNCKDRYCIELDLKYGDSKVEIARRLGVSAKTIGREIERGTVERLDTNLREVRAYSAEYA